MKTFLALLLFPLQLLAQPGPEADKELAGIWKGYLTTTDKKLDYELVINEKDGQLSGYSFTTFVVEGKEIISLKKVTIHWQNNSLIVEDEDLLLDNFPTEAPKKIKQTNTLFLVNESEPYQLTGMFESKATRTMRPARGAIVMEKQAPIAQTKLMAKLDELQLSGSLTFSRTATVTKPILPAATVTPVPSVTTTVTPIPAATAERAAPAIAIADKPAAEIITPQTIAPVEVPVLARLNFRPQQIRVTPTLLFNTALTPFRKDERMMAVVRDRISRPILLAPVETAVAVVPKPAPVISSPAAPVKPAVTPVPEAVPAIVKTVPSPVANVPVLPKETAKNISVAPILDLSKRKIEVIDQLFIEADSLVLTLYDNGTVDGDSVSLILNGRTIVSNQMLSTVAFTKTIYFTPDMGDSIQLVMYAENLGSIPPNTGLLILQYDKQRQEIRFSGDLTKNAAITLRRKPNE